MLLDSEFGKVSIRHNENGQDSVVILGHGYLSDKDSSTIQELEKRLKKEGISTIAFDMYGHGESEGDIEHLTISKAVASMLAVYDFAGSRYERIGIVGSSFTGSVSLIAASKRRPAVLALKCPVFMSKELWDWRYGDRIAEWKRVGFIDAFNSRWSYEAYEDASRLRMREVAASIKAPTLVVHGDRDKTVPLSQAENLVFSLGGEKRLLVIKGADHFFKDERHFDRMAGAITGWLVEHLS